MKILAIRGRSLASLAEGFALDFTSGPLAERGLFAITGPTGAGKSTLLDALCLALFDRTPRLDAKGGAEIGRAEEGAERIRAFDVRSLLSRGRAEGWAQVDFVGRDGRSWRATWRVKRARGKVTGPLQNQTVDLVDLSTGAPVPGTKTEVLAAIEERLGLTFDQFRKSVLLAQGDFADFLKANADDRSRLLQRLTGDEIYERISKAAHEKAREVSNEVDRLRDGLAGITVLTDEEREALAAEARAAAGTVEAAQAREKSLEEVGRLAEASRAARDEAAAEDEAAGKAGEDVTKAEAARGEAAAGRERAKAALDGARAQQEDRRPEIDEARKLDALVAEAEKARDEAEVEAKKARARLAEAEEAARKRQADEAELRRAVEGLDRWLSEHEAARPLAERWDVVDRGLSELVGIAAERKSAEGELRRSKKALDAATAEVTRKGEEEGELDKALAAAEGERKGNEGRLAEVPVDSLRERREALRAYTATLSDLARTRRDALAASGEHARSSEAAADAETKAREDAAGAELARAEAAATGLVLKEARDALGLLEAALGLEERRADLVPGQPCPLCGSTEHPWASEGGLDRQALESQRSRVSQLEREEKGHVARAAKLAESAKSANEAADRERQRANDAAGTRDGALADWAGAVGRASAEPGDPLPPSPLAETAEAALASRRTRAEEEARSLDETLGRADALAKEIARLRSVEDRARARRDTARAARESAEGEVRRGEDAQKTADDRIRHLEELARRETDQLAFVLSRRPDLAERVVAAPGEVRTALETEASGWRAKAGAAEAARTRHVEAEKLLGSAQAAVEPTRDQSAEAAATSERRAQALEERRLARAKLLDGRAVREVEEELAAAVRTADAALDDAGKAATAAETALGAARAQAAAATRHAAEAARKADAAREALAKAATGAGLEGDAAETVVPALAEARTALAAARERETDLRTRVRADDDARAKKAGQEEALARAETSGRVWLDLDALIGSADGKKLRVFAQSLTLEALVQATNHHLRDLARRYRLERVPGTDMELQVVDADLGDERRSVQSLSGGETFLVSLALALGLSSLATRRTRVETLFVDEGFGTLDQDTLERALATLEALHATGRRVGVISHVAALTERIGARVTVTPLGAGRSKVAVE